MERERGGEREAWTFTDRSCSFVGMVVEKSDGYRGGLVSIVCGSLRSMFNNLTNSGLPFLARSGYVRVQLVG